MKAIATPPRLMCETSLQLLVVHHLESLSCRFLKVLSVGLSYDGFFFGILISSCDIIPDEMGLFTLLIVNAGLAPALVRVHGTHIKPTQVRRTRSKVSGL